MENGMRMLDQHGLIDKEISIGLDYYHKFVPIQRYRVEKDGLFDNIVEVIIVTSSLVKDMNSKINMYQVNIHHLM